MNKWETFCKSHSYVNDIPSVGPYDYSWMKKIVFVGPYRKHIKTNIWYLLYYLNIISQNIQQLCP